MLRIAPEHVAVLRARLPDHTLDRLELLLGLLQAAQRQEAVAQVQPGVALDFGVVRSASTIADLGSGTGIPGLPLAIAVPGVEVALVESIARRCAFLERALDACGISNARVVQTRVEAWTDGLGGFDLVTARALAPLGVVVEYAAPILRLGGTLMVWRGRRDPRDEEIASNAAAELGMEPRDIVSVQPYPAAKQRHLHLMSKVTETPRGFPRRAGMALKRPLGVG